MLCLLCVCFNRYPCVCLCAFLIICRFTCLLVLVSTFLSVWVAAAFPLSLHVLSVSLPSCLCTEYGLLKRQRYNSVYVLDGFVDQPEDNSPLSQQQQPEGIFSASDASTEIFAYITAMRVKRWRWVGV